MHTIWYTNQSN